MKNYIKSTITIVALLLYVTTAWAGGRIRVNNTTWVFDGQAYNTYWGDFGSVSATIDENTGTCTLTATPLDGCFITKDYITVVKTIEGENAQTRTPGFNTPIEVSGDDAAIGPDGKNFTFTMPSAEYDVEVSVLFQEIIDIADATITLSESTFTYDGTEKKPTVSSVKLNDTELNATYYAVSYSNNTNAGDATVTVTGNGIYKNAASKTFTISKATITLAYSSDKAEAMMGKEFTAPTLSNQSQVAVTYSSSKTDVATISSEGAVTLVGPGETTITATFAGNDNYEAATASYVLTVAKMQDAGLSWSDAGMEYYLGDWWYGPRLSNPNKLEVTYKSSNDFLSKPVSSELCLSTLKKLLGE